MTILKLEPVERAIRALHDLVGQFFGKTHNVQFPTAPTVNVGTVTTMPTTTVTGTVAVTGAYPAPTPMWNEAANAAAMNAFTIRIT